VRVAPKGDEKRNSSATGRAKATGAKGSLKVLSALSFLTHETSALRWSAGDCGAMTAHSISNFETVSLRGFTSTTALKLARSGVSGRSAIATNPMTAGEAWLRLRPMTARPSLSATAIGLPSSAKTEPGSARHRIAPPCVAGPAQSIRLVRAGSAADDCTCSTIAGGSATAGAGNSTTGAAACCSSGSASAGMAQAASSRKTAPALQRINPVR
jgi:hypothetical protein